MLEGSLCGDVGVKRAAMRWRRDDGKRGDSPSSLPSSRLSPSSHCEVF